MRIIIVGIGKLGEYLTKSLVREGHEITVIDTYFNKHENIINNEDVNYIEGNALNANILKEAGAASADLLICAMDKDEQNVMCSLLAKKLGTKHTIARIRNTEYASSISLLKDDLGLSLTINPDLLTAEYIYNVLSIPTAINTTSFFKGKVEMISLKVKEDSVIKNLTLNKIANKLDRIIICAIERKNKIIIPKGTTKFLEDDKVYITGTPQSINKFLIYLKRIGEKTKKVIICGGSETAVYLSRLLIDSGMTTKIIEDNEERCQKLSEELPQALIIHGDVSNQNVLYEEGIEKADAFVSLTGIDEENIIYSMFASSLNVPKVITKINHINLEGILDKANIDTVITPHIIASNQIVSYIRAMENSTGSSCEALYKFEEEAFEMLEFNIKNDFKGLDTKLRNLKFKEGILIIAIQRGKNIIIPNGNDEIKEKDIIVIIDNKNQVKNINDIIE
mgnify:CR=1 FL=1